MSFGVQNFFCFPFSKFLSVVSFFRLRLCVRVRVRNNWLLEFCTFLIYTLFDKEFFWGQRIICSHHLQIWCIDQNKSDIVGTLLSGFPWVDVIQ